MLLREGLGRQMSDVTLEETLDEDVMLKLKPTTLPRMVKVKAILVIVEAVVRLALPDEEDQTDQTDLSSQTQMHFEI